MNRKRVDLVLYLGSTTFSTNCPADEADKLIDFWREVNEDAGRSGTATITGDPVMHVNLKLVTGITVKDAA